MSGVGVCVLSFHLCLLLFDARVLAPVLLSVSVTVTILVRSRLDLLSVSPSAVTLFPACLCVRVKGPHSKTGISALLSSSRNPPMLHLCQEHLKMSTL